MSKILITGVAGFLGSHLAEALIKDGHEVIGIDNLSGGDKENIPKGMKTSWRGDVRDLSSMLKMCAGTDVVYHCACMPHEGVSMFSPKFVTDSVFSSTMSVVSAAIEKRVKRFVYLSSMARYGDIMSPFEEDMQPRPQDPYGIAKLASEDAIRVLATTHKMEYVIAVPHSIIGPRQNTGKTEWLLPYLTHRCTSPWFGGMQRVLQTAQTADDARTKWRDVYRERLLKERTLRGMFRSRLSLNQEALTWRNAAARRPYDSR